jgi:hypothetical protein
MLDFISLGPVRSAFFILRRCKIHINYRINYVCILTEGSMYHQFLLTEL